MAKSSQPGRRQWRPATAQPRRRTLVVANWRRAESVASRVPTRRWQILRIALGLTAALACYMMAIQVALWFQPVPTVGLYLARAGYLTNLAVPPDPEALHAADLLEALTSGGPETGLLRSWQGGISKPRLAPLDPALWDRDLGKSPEKTVIVYLAGLAGADDGGAFLLRDSAEILRNPGGLDSPLGVATSPTDDLPTSAVRAIARSDKLYVKDVIGRLAQGANRSRRFLILLDVARPPHLPALGILRNDFDDRLRTLEPEAVRAGNVVLIAPSSAPGLSLPSAAGGASAFASAVVAGLGGSAAEGPGRVDADDLAATVAARLKTSPIVLPASNRPRLNLTTAAENRRLPPTDPASPRTIEVAPTSSADSAVDPWADAQTLAQGRPEAFAPHLWRRYRETLLRHEALGRSLGAADSIAGREIRTARRQLLEELNSLKTDLIAARDVAFASSTLSLALPSATGVLLPSLADRRAQFDAIWLAPATEKLAPVADTDRLPFYHLLLDYAEAGTGPADLEKARLALRRLHTPSRPRPSEANLLAILGRDLAPDLAGADRGYGLLAGVLRLRRQAERVAVGAAESAPTAYPAVEQVAPLIAALVAEGDPYRRQAEDLIFATDPNRWEDARRALDRSKSSYDAADVLAGQVRPALAARDQAFADLPFYADWLTRHPDPAAVLPLVDQLEATWAATHKLAGLVRPGVPIASIEAQADLVAAGLEALRGRFDAEVKDCQAAPLSRVGLRGAILALLDTPLLDVQTRVRLRRRLAEATGNLASGPTQGEQTRAAARVGRLALARLGQDWIDDDEAARPVGGTERALRFADLRLRLTDLEGGAASSPQAGRILDAAGRQIGLCQQLLLPVVEARAERAIKDGLQPWPIRLQAVDRLGRGLLGAQVVAIARKIGVSSWGDDPTAIYRRRLIQRLLLAQAGRTLDDHWFGEADDRDEATQDRPSPPYYREVAAQLVADIAKVGPVPDVDRAADGILTTLADRDLKETRRLTLVGPPSPVIVTDEPNFEPHYRAVPPDSAARGFDGRPVVWYELGDGVQVRRADPPGAGMRLDVPIAAVQRGSGESDRDWSPGRLTFPQVEEARRADARRPRVESAQFRLEGRYRGQILRDPTDFEAHPVPEIVIQQAPPPPDGSVAVLADRDLIARFGGTEGALTLVLDCSGSMGLPANAPAGATPKFREATAAVRRVLERLNSGTRLSIWAFGQALNPEPTANPPEKAIRRVVPPIIWRSGDARLLDWVMAQIEPPALRPWNKSPIVDAMLLAKADLEEATEPRSLVVLTDGRDNCYNKGEIGAALTRGFGGTGIDISIVGYKIDGTEGDVRGQFRAIEQLQPPGRFVPVSEAEDLTSALRPTLRYLVRTVDNVPIRGAVELSDGLAAPPFRDLTPGYYKLAAEAGNWFERPIAIHQGDRLIVRLGQSDRQLTMSRMTWTDTLPGVPRVEVGDWRLSAVSNRVTKERALTLWASLEHLPDPHEAAMEVIRPHFTWMEVKPPGDSDVSFQQRWRQVAGLPAPTWELSVAGWPDGPEAGRPAEPRIQAAWDAWGQGDPALIPIYHDANLANPATGRTVATPSGPVTIASLTVEPVDPQVPNGPKRLVVRISHARGKRFLIRPVGLTPASAEHRLYLKAGRTTGEFWPLTDDQVRTYLVGIHLIAVDDFRTKARQGGTAVDDLNARVPVEGAPGPERFPGVDPEPAAPAAPIPLPRAVIR